MLRGWHRHAWLWLVFAAAACAQPATPAPPTTPARYQRVDIAPTKTSIYIGTVAMTIPTMERREGGYEATYVAKVFPYFFYNEHGALRIEFSDEALRRLAGGEVVEFTGRARNADGEDRRIEGKATPEAGTDGRKGKIKVRVRVSASVELIFNTTYAFADK